MLNLERNKPLAPLTTFQIGGPAAFFVSVRNRDDLEETMNLAVRDHLPVFILGGGSNLLVSDKGFPGLVIHSAIEEVALSEEVLTVGSGVSMPHLLETLSAQGLSGLEWAGGLPGTVGGAIRGNAGCFGGEIKDSLLHAVAFDVADFNWKTFPLNECAFAYRSSTFKINPHFFIAQGVFRLKPGQDPATLRNAVEEKIAYRKERHPLEFPNAGSIFKNVPLASIKPQFQEYFLQAGVVKSDPFPVVPTAFIISECGLQGLQAGSAQVSFKHPNFIINRGNATAKDAEELISIVKANVREKFSIELQEEIQRVP